MQYIWKTKEIYRNISYLLLTILVIIIIMALNSNSKSGHKYKKATFAGGCFWCLESAFQETDGVAEVISGYTGGPLKSPTYKQVSSGNTGHLEAVQITYDPSKINYSNLLKIFSRQIDPTDSGGQFADRGTQYRTAIFYHSDKQKNLAMQSKEKLGESSIFEKPIVTEIKKHKNSIKQRITTKTTTRNARLHINPIKMLQAAHNS